MDVTSSDLQIVGQVTGTSSVPVCGTRTVRLPTSQQRLEYQGDRPTTLHVPGASTAVTYCDRGTVTTICSCGSRVDVKETVPGICADRPPTTPPIQRETFTAYGRLDVVWTVTKYDVTVAARAATSALVTQRQRDTFHATA